MCQTRHQDAARLLADLAALAKNVNKSLTGKTELNKLPASFQPGPLDVICGRGRRAYDHNEHFRELVADSLERYDAASSKVAKTGIVSDIIDKVRDQSPSGGFVRNKGGTWLEVGDSIAREKVSAAIRELLHTKYKSSTKARKRRREQEEEDPEISTTPTVNKRERKALVPASKAVVPDHNTHSISVFGQFFTDISISGDEDRTFDFSKPEGVASNNDEVLDFPMDTCFSSFYSTDELELDAVDAALLKIAPFKEWDRQSFIMIAPPESVV